MAGGVRCEQKCRCRGAHRILPAADRHASQNLGWLLAAGRACALLRQSSIATGSGHMSNTMPFQKAYDPAGAEPRRNQLGNSSRQHDAWPDGSNLLGQSLHPPALHSINNTDKQPELHAARARRAHWWEPECRWDLRQRPCLWSASPPTDCQFPAG